MRGAARVHLIIPSRGVSAHGPHVGAPIDANGNLTSDGSPIVEWDARNQLVAVNAETRRVEFAYDGAGQRVRRVEREGGTRSLPRQFNTSLPLSANARYAAS